MRRPNHRRGAQAQILSRLRYSTNAVRLRQFRRIGCDTACRTRYIYFSHHNLDFHRFHLVGEDLLEHLGILVRQATGVDVFSAVLIALEFRERTPAIRN